MSMTLFNANNFTAKETHQQTSAANKITQPAKAEQHQAGHAHEGHKLKDYLEKEEHKFGEFMKKQEKETDTDNDKYAGLM